MEPIWRQDDLRVPRKQQERRRLWLNDTASIRLRREKRNHVWGYDFVDDRTCDGRAYRILVVIDEFIRQCLSLAVARRPNSNKVIHTLAELFCHRDRPEYIRSGNGAEFTAKTVKKWLVDLEVALQHKAAAQLTGLWATSIGRKIDARRAPGGCLSVIGTVQTSGVARLHKTTRLRQANSESSNLNPSLTDAG